MRIGIDLRLLSGGGLTVRRGMGRYTLQQLREVLRRGASPHAAHQYVLFLREDADAAALPPEAAAPNVETAWLPPLAQARWEMARPEDALRATEDFQRAIDERAVDVFHLTAPCHLDDLVPTSLDGPLVATHYDLIPALYPRHYHVEPGRRELYERALRTVRRADRLIAISHHAAREATAVLGVPSARIRVAWPVADPCFRPLPEEERERILAPLRRRLGLAGDFLLSVSHLHHAKNLRGLLDAWRLLPAAARRVLPLVLACELNPADEATVRGWARDRGIEDGLLLTEFLGDDELAALYNAAAVYVHPSRGEGFGLPVLEAMRCGAAVAAADAGPLSEVVGDAGVLFDPEDPAALARALEALWLDPGRRRELGARAVERAAGFRAEDLGRETLAAYEEAATASATGRPRKALRLALWTPVPPQQSGISDYSVELLREMVRWAEVEVFTDDGVLPAAEMADLAPVRPWPAFARRDRRRPFDAVLYQLGASFFHFYMDEALRSRPGIVTLHDLTWGALVHRASAVWGEDDAFRRALAASEGEAAAAEYAALSAGAEGDPAVLAARLEDFLNRHPLLGGAVATSLAEIVHMPRAAAELEALYPGARVFTFPMGIEDPRRALPADGRNDLRPRLGIAPEAFVVGVFGVADPVKRLESAVRALARLAAEAPETDPVLLIAGGFPDPLYRERVETLAAELGVAERVRLLGRAARRDFDLALLACDTVVNLRYPFRHQMSATLMRGIAAGRPVVITDVPAWDFPADFCLRVAPDEGEVDALSDHLLRLAREPELRREMGEAARRFWRENATPAHMADGYRRVLEEVVCQGRKIEIVEPDPMSERAPGIPVDLPSPEDEGSDAPNAPLEEPPSPPRVLPRAEEERPVEPPTNPAEEKAEGPGSLSPGRRPGPGEEIYRRWDALRARTSRDPAAGILGRTMGFLRRTAGRVRDLGLSAELQRDLFRALLDRQAELDEKLRTLDLENLRALDLARLRTLDLKRLRALDLERLQAVEKDLADRLAAAETELARLRASDADVRGAINELRAQPADEELRVQVVNLRDRQETLRARQARVEGIVADLRELLAAPPAIPKVPLSPRDLAELLAALDDGAAGAVEVSFQDVRAESLLLAARRHFGGRLASSGPSYRSPNDLWIHTDFTAHWDRPILLENAAARLAPGGRFLLVTAVAAVAAGEAPEHAGMTLEEDRVVSLAGGAVVRLISWRKPTL
jgi:glycosyltransferase involved in cell wall biosynthesis